MRIAIVCNDTRGGVQPYVALGAGLLAAGFDVRAVAPSGLDTMFAAAGIAVRELSGSASEMQDHIRSVAEKGSFAAMRLAARELPKRILTWTREALEGCEGADIVTGGVGGMVIGLPVADKIGAGFVETHLQPVGRPSGEYPGVMCAGVPRWFGATGRWASHVVSEALVWGPFQPAMRKARREILGAGAAAASRSSFPVLYGFSPFIVPLQTTARRTRRVTGYWSLRAPDSWRPPAGLEAFLQRPGPVVSVGFGSMASEDEAATTEIIVAGARAAGARTVLLSGWGGLGSLQGAPDPDDVFVLDSAPHDWLFPRVDAVVHHGGAGTTGAGVASGKPSIVVPFAMDQFFWADRIVSLGVGPAPIPRKRLTSARLAAALQVALGNQAMRQRASELGVRVRREDGVARAVEIFSSLDR